MPNPEFLTGEQEMEAAQWMNTAAEIAGGSLCLSKQCGTIIVKDSKIIGQGYNGPPQDNLEFRTCGAILPADQHDSCVHAEQRAIMDALRRNADRLKDSSLYYTRVDQNGEIKKSGKPYCTVCSRLALDVGIAKFVLWHEEGIREYPTDEYNRLSYIPKAQ